MLIDYSMNPRTPPSDIIDKETDNKTRFTGGRMEEIRLLTVDESNTYLKLNHMAYPRFPITPERREKLQTRLRDNGPDSPSQLYGYFSQDQLLGSMILYSYTINVYGHFIPACGIGGVAVHLMHKKEHIAKTMISYAHDLAHRRGQNLVLLYPFRPDFYAKMGYGIGPKRFRYVLKPTAFPSGSKKTHLEALSEADVQRTLDSYHRVYQKTHGLIAKSKKEMTLLLSSPENYAVGFSESGTLRGYLAFQFENASETNFVKNNMVILEWVNENRYVFEEMCAFLNSQSDQIHRIIVGTEDESFHLLPSDPRDGSDELIPSVYHQCGTFGVGLMYRLLDPAAFIEATTKDTIPETPPTAFIRWEIQDPFFSNGNQTIATALHEGRLYLTSRPSSVTIRIGIAEFSSLLMGCCDLRALQEYGKITIDSQEDCEKIARSFRGNPKPICKTDF